jgi:hypothetical protein
MARTDAELERVLSTRGMNPVSRDKYVAFYNLLRGDYETAARGFQNVIEANRRFPERSIGAYICAAAAAHELGQYKESRRHYENAELTMCCNCNRLVFCQYLTWLVALCQHWGWEAERNRWTQTISVLDCPEATRSCLFERAHSMEDVCRGANALVFA